MATSKFSPLSELRRSLQQSKTCNTHGELRACCSPEEADLWWESIQLCSPQARLEHLRWFAKNDLYFLAVFILHRWHLIGDKEAPAEFEDQRKEQRKKRDWRKARWFCARAIEVQAEPDCVMDGWSREHGKSELISFALTIRDIIRNPNITFGIFSHNKSLAKKLLKPIKTEFESNHELIELFPEIFYGEPRLEAISDGGKWAEDAITVKRTVNRKEATVEAWGLIDAQPTMVHFDILLYDDVVARKEVSSADVIENVTEEFENSLFLGASDPRKWRYVFTFQEVGDTSQQLIEKGFGTFRKRIGIDIDENSPTFGQSLFWSDETLAEFKQRLAPKVFALQVLLDPKKAQTDQHVGFRAEVVEDLYYDSVNLNSVNKYIIVDPAGESKDSNSYFALWVVGLAPDRRIKILDYVYDKLDLDGRTRVLKERVLKFAPYNKGIMRVFYEQHAMQADIAHIKGEMRREMWEVEIIAVGDNRVSKDQRIEWLVPMFNAKMIHFPRGGIMYRPTGIPEWKGQSVNLVEKFFQLEYHPWPHSRRKDGLDALSRVKDPMVEVMLQWPRPYGDSGTRTGAFGIGEDSSGGWMCQ